MTLVTNFISKLWHTRVLTMWQLKTCVRNKILCLQNQTDKYIKEIQIFWFSVEINQFQTTYNIFRISFLLLSILRITAYTPFPEHDQAVSQIQLSKEFNLRHKSIIKINQFLNFMINYKLEVKGTVHLSIDI